MNPDIMKYVIKEKDLPQDAKIENDMITELYIRRDRGLILGLDMNFASRRQSLFSGHYNTANIGFMLLALADILDVNDYGESPNFLQEFERTPIRIATDGGFGEVYVNHVWLGHFMDDRWIRASDIVKFGLNTTKSEGVNQ